MGHDLVTLNKSENPFDRESDSDQYYQHEKENLEWVRYAGGVWLKLLQLASLFGWKPIGTQWSGMKYPENTPKPDDWDGSYLANEGQIVLEEDATALVNSLEIALDHLPKTICIHKDDLSSTDEWELNPIDFFSGSEGIKLVSDFITFCRKGAFYIL